MALLGCSIHMHVEPRNILTTSAAAQALSFSPWKCAWWLHCKWAWKMHSRSLCIRAVSLRASQRPALELSMPSWARYPHMNQTVVLQFDLYLLVNHTVLLNASYLTEIPGSLVRITWCCNNRAHSLRCKSHCTVLLQAAQGCRNGRLATHCL
jgi:hypothetical protein